MRDRGTKGQADRYEERQTGFMEGNEICRNSLLVPVKTSYLVRPGLHSVKFTACKKQQVCIVRQTK